MRVLHGKQPMTDMSMVKTMKSLQTLKWKENIKKEKEAHI